MNAKLSFMLDVRRLRVLHAISAYGSVTAAAASLGYSAPAVSQQLAALEREVGMRLTERAGRGLVLTPAALILVGHTDALLARLEAAEADLAALRDQIAGRVTLAAFPSAAASLVPAAWAALAGSAPQVRLDLTEMEPEESLPAVLRGETDVAVAHEYDLLPVTTSASEAMAADSDDADLAPFLDELASSQLYPVGKTSWAAVSADIKKQIGKAVSPDGSPAGILGSLQQTATTMDSAG